MKNKTFISIIGVLIALVMVFFFEMNNNKPTNKDILMYVLNGKKYRLLIADTTEKWEKGLMYYRKLKEADGMIFLFPEKSMKTFWNKNTFMDLNLYWLDDDRITGQSFLPSIEKSGEIVVVSSQEKVNKVVELVVNRQ